MSKTKTFLVLGATGGTGKHFVSLALRDGHHVRALARDPSKLSPELNLELVKGSITDPSLDVGALVQGVDYVVAMLGDREAQNTTPICDNFIRRLVPAMRTHGVKRILFQAGAMSKPPNESLSWILWTLRYTLGRSFAGQHEDNAQVMEYFSTEANDIEWIVHRAGVYGDGPSKGTLVRSKTKYSIGVHADAAAYNYRTVLDDAAVRTHDFSCYQ